MVTTRDRENEMFLDDEGDDASIFEAEMYAMGQKQATVALQKGRIVPFWMPSNTDKDNKRRATIRFITPFRESANAILHGPFKEDYVCPREFEMECDICDPIIRKHKIKRRDLKINPKKYLGKDTSVVIAVHHMWLIWYYEDDEGKGRVRLLAEKMNKNTPLTKLAEINQDLFIEAESRGEKPIPITDYDIKLVQIGEKTEKEYAPVARPPSPFKFQKQVDEFMAALLQGNAYSPLVLKFGLALWKSKNDNEYLVQLQDARLRMTGIGPDKAVEESTDIDDDEVEYEPEPITLNFDDDEDE